MRACLEALIHQQSIPRGSYGVLLFLNNCTDGTETIVADVAEHSDLPIRVLERHDSQATAGWARRVAMEAASSWLGDEGADNGIILTTDADSRVGPNWIADNLACLAAGADAVAGRIMLDPDEAALLPSTLHARGRLEADYESLLTEIDARLDPDAWNMWPCHWTTSGASLAVRRTVYNAIGGMPPIALGEDRAFVEALRAFDARVRHCPDIVVVTSGRLEGRAAGGVADTMKVRCEEIDCFCDPRLEAVHLAIGRAGWRRRLRRLHQGGMTGDVAHWASHLQIGIAEARRAMSIASFGAAFAAIESRSPILAFRPLRPSELPVQIELARLVLRYLDHRQRESRSDHRPVDIDPFELGARVARRVQRRHAAGVASNHGPESVLCTSSQ